ncbi:MAG: hypothetical protein JHC31_06565 [Sulfurihydrogenibium sp.]|jgi:hypothetical protein|nr:hypothetical protein [Sulfurihydrogenibium sp.]
MAEIATSNQKLKLRLEKHSPSTLKLILSSNDDAVNNEIVIQPQGILRVYEVIIGLRLKEYLKSGELHLTIENRYDERIRFFLSNNNFVYYAPISVFKEIYKRKVKELDNLIMIDGHLTAMYKNKEIILITGHKKLNVDLNKLKGTLIDHMFFKKGFKIGGIYLDQKACMRLYAFIDMLI